LNTRADNINQPKYKVLVTGAAGFIGSHVADHCKSLGMDVVATDDLSGGFIENVPGDVKWVQGDLRNRDFVTNLWSEYGPFDFVYHLAAYAAEGLSHFIRGYNYTTNLVASMHVLNESIKHKAKCFVFTSSIAVYGSNQVPMTENLVPQPEDPYGISKYAVELDLKAAYKMFGLDFIVFRPHNVYGERQNIADRYRNVIGIFMNQALLGKPLTVFGDGLQTRAFSHVDDVAPIIAKSPLVAQARNSTFNIGADIPYTILQLAEEVSVALGINCSIKYLPARNEVVHAFASHDLVRQIFDPPAPINLKCGIQRMADWIKSRGPTTPIQFSDIEVRDQLPPGWE
jgi:UDP-glucose 4-epimerase